MVVCGPASVELLESDVKTHAVGLERGPHRSSGVILVGVGILAHWARVLCLILDQHLLGGHVRAC